MKKLLVLIASVTSLTAADLGVLYNDTNNLISPASLGIANLAVNTNLSLPNQTPSRALSLDNNSNVVSSSLSSLQQGYLASMIGNTNILYLGGTPVFSGSGNPTNGVVFTNISFYINSTAADVAHTFYFSFGTNWLSLYSTNGGSIVESQLNFSDVTTANSTTNKHGLLSKLDGVSTDFMAGDGTWKNPLVSNLSGITNGYHLVASGSVGPGSTGVSQSRLSENLDILTINGAPFTPGQLRANSLFATNNFTGGDLFITGFTDNTTGDATTGHHGLLPKPDGNSAHFLNGLGTYSTPAGGGGSVATTGSPVAGEVAYMSGTNTITGNLGFTYDGTTLFANQVQATSGVFNQITVSTTTVLGNVYSGRYTPIRTPINNASTAGTVSLDQHFTRVGNQVTVNGLIFMSRIGSGLVNFSITLPTTTEAVNPSTLNGFGNVSDGADLFSIGQVVIYADARYPNQAVFKSVGSSTSGTLRAFHYSFTYNTN